jgi:hypothetical protein
MVIIDILIFNIKPIQLNPNPDKPELNIDDLRLKIEDLWYRFALSFLLKSIAFLKYSTWLWYKSCANMM